MNRVLVVTATLGLLLLGTAAQADVFNLGTGFTNLETVRVGDAGNAAYSGSGRGSVSYSFNIGKYEVTAKQYTDFLNAKAKTDTYGLYNNEMWNSKYGCKIQRSGTSGYYTYSVASSGANRPVNFVSYWDCCRFVNWLGNGQGSGDTETGSYTLTTDGITDNTVVRNAGWKWAVTSENEWYKAAYYKGGSTDAGYWWSPTQTNPAPGRDMADVSGNNANCYSSNGTGAWPIDYPYYTTVVGEFQNSDGPYGTFDQAGNVREWNEKIIGGVQRGVRGGSFFHYTSHVSQSQESWEYPTTESYSLGYRISQSQVPEPSSFIALGALVTPLLAFRRRKGK